MAILLHFLLVALPGIAWADDAATYATGSSGVEGYVVGAQDVLEITLYDEPDLSRTVTVSEAGEVFLPLVERVPVAALTTPDIAALIEKRYKEGEFLVHPHAMVRVIEYKSQQVEVVGGVVRPGLYNLTGPTTLSEIVAQAGWIDAQAVNGQATVRRRDGTRITVDLAPLVRTGEGNLPLQAGDHVSVVEGEVIFIKGQVNKPGNYPFYQGLTANQALSLAGDASPVARLSGAFVLRGEEQIRVNLKKIGKGRSPDVLLQPGDTLSVPESVI